MHPVRAIRQPDVFHVVATLCLVDQGWVDALDIPDGADDRLEGLSTPKALSAQVDQHPFSIEAQRPAAQPHRFVFHALAVLEPKMLLVDR